VVRGVAGGEITPRLTSIISVLENFGWSLSEVKNEAPLTTRRIDGLNTIHWCP
jgi:hypothetical protein